MTPTLYCKKQLNFTMQEWGALSDADKAWYKEAARVEMNVLGIEVK